MPVFKPFFHPKKCMLVNCPIVGACRCTGDREEGKDILEGVVVLGDVRHFKGCSWKMILDTASYRNGSTHFEKYPLPSRQPDLELQTQIENANLT